MGNFQYFINENQSFGAASMLLGSYSLGTVTVASESATILQFDPTVLKTLLDKNSLLAAHFMRYLCCVLQGEIEMLGVYNIIEENEFLP